MLLKLRCVILPSSRLSTLLVLLGCFVLLLSLHLSHCILCIDHIQDIWSFDNQYFSFLCILLDIAFCLFLKPALMFIVAKDILIMYLCISCNISQPKRTHSFLFSSEITWWQIFVNPSLCMFLFVCICLSFFYMYTSVITILVFKCLFFCGTCLVFITWYYNYRFLGY